MGNSNYVQAYINNVNNKVKFLLPQGDGRRPAPNSRMWNEKTLITNYQNYENGRYVVKYPAMEEKLAQPENYIIANFWKKKLGPHLANPE